MAKFSPTKSDSVFIFSANKRAATQSPWSRNARFSAPLLPKKWLDIKRHRYDDIIMGFYDKAFDNSLQAKAAGSKPILFPANQNLGRSGLIILRGAFPCARPLSIAHHHVVHIACLNQFSESTPLPFIFPIIQWLSRVF